MCLIKGDDSNRARRMTAIGCICLAVALSERTLTGATTSATAHAWIDSISGLLVGMSVTLNLYALRLRKRANR